MILCDPAAERAVLAGICTYGESAYLDVADIVQEISFTIDIIQNRRNTTSKGYYGFSS